MSYIRQTQPDTDTVIKTKGVPQMNRPDEQPNNQSNNFADSVFGLTADDLVKEKRKKSLINLLFDNIRTVVLIVCGAVLIWSLQYIVKSLIHYRMADDVYGQLGDIFNDGGDAEIMIPSALNPASPDYESCKKLSQDDIDGIIKPTPVDPEYERIRNKLFSLKEQYPNLYGWIILENTKINYPIMQTDNNEYYLTHSYDGKALMSGSIFADYRCDETLTQNRNLILYGHHMSSSALGSMFQSLDKFLDEDFFKNNNEIKIYTLDGMYTYKVFAVYDTNKYYPYITTYFPNEDSFVSFAERIAGNSVHKADFTVGAGDSILTLSTCSNRSEDGRLAVHAVLVKD